MIEVFGTNDSHGLLVAATHNGDIIVWNTDEIFKAVERRLNSDECYESEEESKGDVDTKMNPEEDQDIIKDNVEHGFHVESLKCWKYFKSPLLQQIKSSKARRIRIHHLCATTKFLFLSHTFGFTIYDVTAL